MQRHTDRTQPLKVASYGSRNERSRDRLIPELVSGGLVIRADVVNSFLFIGTGRKFFANPLPKISSVDVEKVTEINALGELVEENANINGEPVIPGSTLKGSVRSRIEHLFMPHDNTIEACYSVSKVRGRVSQNRFNRRHLKVYGYPKYGGTIPERGHCSPPEEVCVVCDMFGALSLGSKVNFSDALMERGGYEVRTMSFGHNKGNYVLVDPGSVFKFTVSFINLTWEQLGLLLMGMRLHEGKPMLIGRFKYAKRKVNDQLSALGRVKMSLLEAYTYNYRGGIPVRKREDARIITKAVDEAKSKFKLRDLDEAVEVNR
ncbi:MAG: RAMP superfamily CRISPR-associated protein [Candidatus Jordarchaeales archaeon]